MIMRKKTTKLALGTETLRSLSADLMNDVAGGYQPPPTQEDPLRTHSGRIGHCVSHTCPM